VLLVSAAFAGTITGKVTSKETGDALLGANVYLQGMPVGAATDEGGMYSFDVKNGSYVLVCDYVGYAKETTSITVSGTVTYDFELVEFLFAKTISVVADRARDRETPVAYSNVKKERMKHTLASRDIPMVLNTTPSVYATQMGGGAGDARINVRGFDQRNIAVMINGMPMNDMENGWVYWSNWDGVGDATSSIEMQRGLSAANLATPAIGGSMNIITDPTAHNSGLLLRQEFGTGSFLKTTLSGHTGLIDDKWAVSATVVKRAADGIVDATWADTWAWYIGAAYNINENHRLELYGLGAPQRHGQNLYMQNITTYSREFAKDVGYTAEELATFEELGRKYNQNWAPVSSSYTGQQNWNGSNSRRFDPNFINERENFFHKPLANLNWYAQLSKKVSLYTIAYWSGGHGGGTGTLGSVSRIWSPYNYTNPTGEEDTRGPWLWNWDGEIEDNRDRAQNGTTQIERSSGGILRNSRNNQWTIGLISKAIWKVDDNWKTLFGIDWRTAEIDHYREVRDLLGGIYFDPRVDPDDVGTSDFWSEEDYKRGLGDKVDYNFTNTVDWFGAFAQGKYTKGKISAVGIAGLTMIKYHYTDHFRTADTLANGDPNTSSGEYTAESDNISGYQVKGGVSYRISEGIDVFGNLGYVSKVPIFDNVIDDGDGAVNNNPVNEEFTHIEGGFNHKLLNGKLTYKANAYYTIWKNRARTLGAQDAAGREILVAIEGMDQTHYGFELEMVYQPMPELRFDLAGTVGNWEFTDDASGRIKNYAQPEQTQDYFYTFKGLKVGDSPQMGGTLGISVLPVDGMTFSIIGKYYQNHWAAWDLFDRAADPDDQSTWDRDQSWKIPSYFFADLHFTYNLPLNWNGVGLTLFAHGINVFDTEYLSDAIDNSQYNGAGDGTHRAADAEVFFGIPAFWNIGLELTY
jgi:hypothetical protein